MPRLQQAREKDANGGAGPFFGIDRQEAVVVADDSQGDAQSHAGPLADGLGSEKGIGCPAQDFRRHAPPAIANFQMHILAGRDAIRKADLARD